MYLKPSRKMSRNNILSLIAQHTSACAHYLLAHRQKKYDLPYYDVTAAAAGYDQYVGVCVCVCMFLSRILICFIYMFMPRKPFDLSAIRVFNSRFCSQL